MLLNKKTPWGRRGGLIFCSFLIEGNEPALYSTALDVCTGTLSLKRREGKRERVRVRDGERESGRELDSRRDRQTDRQTETESCVM